jgi:hypothetical protein
MPLTPINGVSLKRIQLVGVATGSLKNSDGTSIKCDAHLAVIDDDGNTYYLPLYDTTN